MQPVRLVAHIVFCLMALMVTDDVFGIPERVVAPDANKAVMQRTVVHTEAYKRRDNLGPHLEIMVTPPEHRGRKGYLLVEVYNHSKTNVGRAEFSLNLANKAGYSLDAHIICANIRSGLSALQWIKIPGDGSIPKITAINVANMRMASDHAQALKLPFSTDLIKR